MKIKKRSARRKEKKIIDMTNRPGGSKTNKASPPDKASTGAAGIRALAPLLRIHLHTTSETKGNTNQSDARKRDGRYSIRHSASAKLTESNIESTKFSAHHFEAVGECVGA